MTTFRKPYPSDVSDEEWALVAPYLTLLPETAGQREHSLREVFNGLRYIVKTGAPWRWVPNDLPPWAAVYQQARRWLAAGCFEALVDDLRAVLRLAAGRKAEPSAAVLDSRTLRSTPESGARAGYDGAKRKKGSKLHLAVDTLGHLLALHVTPATTDDRTEVGHLAQAVQIATGESVELAFVDQGYMGEKPAAAAAAHGIMLEVVKLPEAKRGFVLLPRRWVAERTFAWTTRFRRLVRDYERLPQTLADLHVVALVCIMLKQAAQLAAGPYQPLDAAGGRRGGPWPAGAARRSSRRASAPRCRLRPCQPPRPPCLGLMTASARGSLSGRPAPRAAGAATACRQPSRRNGTMKLSLRGG